MGRVENCRSPVLDAVTGSPLGWLKRRAAQPVCYEVFRSDWGRGNAMASVSQQDEGLASGSQFGFDVDPR